MEDPIKEAEEVEEKKIAELKNRMTKSKKERKKERKTPPLTNQPYINWNNKLSCEKFNFFF